MASLPELVNLIISMSGILDLISLASSPGWGWEHLGGFLCPAVIALRALTIQRMALLLGGPDVKWVPGKDDDNPPRFYEPLPTGPHKGSKVDKDKFLEMRREYFSMLGWDENGVPRKETLKRLGLGDYWRLMEELN